MKRILALVLGDVNNIHNSKKLILMNEEQDKIDKYTIKLNSSEDIRCSKKFKTLIDAFLKTNSSFANICQHKNGDIVLLECLNSDDEKISEYRQLKVLYKKHKDAFSEMIKDQETMKTVLDLEKKGLEKGYRPLFSHCMKDNINGSYYKGNIKNISSNIKKAKDYYDILRLIVKAYNIQRSKGRNEFLPTIDSIHHKKTSEGTNNEPKNKKQNNKSKSILKSKDKISSVNSQIFEDDDLEEDTVCVTRKIKGENGDIIYVNTIISDGEEGTFDDIVRDDNGGKRLRFFL